jgi:bacteriocin biosynthesis cyclodehydratase domain-containing protein
VPHLLVTVMDSALARLPVYPQLAPWVRVVWRDGRAILEHGGRAVVLEGRAVQRLVPALLPLLDGTRELERIVTAIGRAAAPAVESALALLAGHRMLVDGPPLSGALAPNEVAAARFEAALGALAPAEVHRRLGASTVAIAGTAPAADELIRLLEACGIGAVRRVERADVEGVDLAVAAPAPEEAASLLDWNDARLRDGVPWLPMLPFDGRFAIVGPLIVPGESACFRCYQLRRAANSDLGDDHDAVEAVTTRAATPLPIAVAATGLAATIAVGWLARHDRGLPGRLLAIEHVMLPGVATHFVLRVPRCPVCGDPRDRAVASPWFKEER